MISPVCHHTLPTKTKLEGEAPKATGWIFTCREDYEHAVRANLVAHADAKKALDLEAELMKAREKIQQLELDAEDMRRSRRTAFIRCGCGRMRELNIDCRNCGV